MQGPGGLCKILTNSRLSLRFVHTLCKTGMSLLGCITPESLRFRGLISIDFWSAAWT